MEIIAIYFKDHFLFKNKLVPLSSCYDIKLDTNNTNETKIFLRDLNYNSNKDHLPSFSSVISYVGSNGAGKSSLLNSILRTLDTKNNPNYSTKYAIIAKEDDNLFYATNGDLSFLLNDSPMKKLRIDEVLYGNYFCSYHRSSKDWTFRTSNYKEPEEFLIDLHKYSQFVKQIDDKKEIKHKLIEILPFSAIYYLDIKIDTSHVKPLRIKKDIFERIQTESSFITQEMLIGEEYEISIEWIESYVSRWTKQRDINIHNKEVYRIYFINKYIIASLLNELILNSQNEFLKTVSLLLITDQNLRDKLIKSPIDFINSFPSDWMNENTIQYINQLFLKLSGLKKNTELYYKEIPLKEENYLTISLALNDLTFTGHSVEHGITFKNPSSGEESLTNILSWLYSLKAKLNDRQAIIFIDEPDENLHLNWQREFLAIVSDLFDEMNLEKKPSLLFATHSPFLLGDLQSNNIVYLSKKDQSIAKNDKKNPFLQNLYDICYDSFFLEDSKGELSSRYLSKLLKEIRNTEQINIDQYLHLKSKVDIIGDVTIKDLLLEELRLKVYEELKKDPDIHQKYLAELNAKAKL